jgi:hypothetical protein
MDSKKKKKQIIEGEKKTTVFRTETGDVKKENGKCWLADKREREIAGKLD